MLRSAQKLLKQNFSRILTCTYHNGISVGRKQFLQENLQCSFWQILCHFNENWNSYYTLLKQARVQMQAITHELRDNKNNKVQKKTFIPSLPARFCTLREGEKQQNGSLMSANFWALLGSS